MSEKKNVRLLYPNISKSYVYRRILSYSVNNESILKKYKSSFSLLSNLVLIDVPNIYKKITENRVGAGELITQN